MSFLMLNMYLDYNASNPTSNLPSNVFIGNTTSSTDPCNRTVCAYTGYTFNNISAELVTQNTCAG